MWEEFRSHALALLGEHFPPELIEDNGDSIVFTRSSELSGGGAIAGSGRVEVGQERVLPLAQGVGPGERFRG